MLDQHAKETFQAAQQRAVDHVRAVRLSILTNVGQVKSFRFIEVELDGGKLPFTTDGVFHLQVDLRTVERATAGIHIIFQARAIQ